PPDRSSASLLGGDPLAPVLATPPCRLVSVAGSSHEITMRRLATVEKRSSSDAYHIIMTALHATMAFVNSFIQNQFERNFVTTSVDYVFNWARKSALWPLTFGLACCAIEMIASSTSRFDIARFGAEVFRPSPRQSDLMIVAGTVTLKMAPVLKRIWVH